MNDVQKKVRGRPRKGQTDRQADREALIAAAVAILDAGGPGALTARAVAERAGTAVGSVYTQFDSLELLRLEANAITMRRLRDALHGVLMQLQFGQVLLASIGATAPFIGLFGTVWGIYHALLGIAAAGNLSIDRISGPVGEALVMTAAGLAVAIPAVLAYNVFGKLVGACEAVLEGFAHDLREMLLDDASAPRPAGERG